MAVRAYIALGSNLEKPAEQLQRAVDEIAGLPDTDLVACSRLYRSAPVGPSGQPDYCNAVVAVDTPVSSLSLLDQLQAIENSHGRVRTIRWGARTLDLDVLLYGQQIIKNARLTVPHYQMHVRNFVLAPLNDIAPKLLVPGFTCVSAMLNELGYDGLSVIADEYPWL